MPDRTYIAIDLKSFYASVECADRRLDPLATNLRDLQDIVAKSPSMVSSVGKKTWSPIGLNWG